MRRLVIIGIGAGDPDHMTVQAIDALNSADVVLVPEKEGKDGLAALRHEICRRFMTRTDWRTVAYKVPKRATPDPSYRQAVDDWHEAIGDIWGRLLNEEVKDDETAAYLVWGDPSIYDSTLRIVERLAARGDVAFDYEVIPGITSIQALAARHRIALNTIGGPINVTTGRRLGQEGSGTADSIVVMLDGERAFTTVDADEFDIYWGANLGTASEVTIAGRLSEKSAEITEARAKARDKAGWVMDTYLLRRKDNGAKE